MKHIFLFCLIILLLIGIYAGIKIVPEIQHKKTKCISVCSLTGEEISVIDRGYDIGEDLEVCE